jgi:hypothetical protein
LNVWKSRREKGGKRGRERKKRVSLLVDEGRRGWLRKWWISFVNKFKGKEG